MRLAILLAAALATSAAAQTPQAARAPVTTPPVDPAAATDDLNAAVRPPPANSDADAPAAVRALEDRAAEALDPANPANTAVFQQTGPGCGQNGAMLSCGTNLEVRDRPNSPATSSPTPDRDLMGRPR